MAEEHDEPGSPPGTPTKIEFNGVPIGKILSGASENLPASKEAQYAQAAAAAVAALTQRYGLAPAHGGPGCTVPVIVPAGNFAAVSTGRKTPETPTELYAAENCGPESEREN